MPGRGRRSPPPSPVCCIARRRQPDSPPAMAGAQLPHEPTGEALFESELELIERVISFVSARHHLPGVEADDFGSHVKLKLIEDDYGILRKFEGRSSLRTFLTTVITRLFLDYRIAAWGKWRPSAEAKRAGEVAILLERLTRPRQLQFRGSVRADGNESSSDRGPHGTGSDRRPAAEPRERRFESDEALAAVPATQPAPDELIADQERAVIAARVEVAAQEGDGGARRAGSAHLRAAVSRRALVGRHRQGAPARPESALPPGRTAAEGSCTAELKAGGIDGEAALEIFGRAAVSIEWGSDTDGTVEPRSVQAERSAGMALEDVAILRPSGWRSTPMVCSTPSRAPRSISTSPTAPTAARS